MSLFYNMFTITLMISAPIIIAALGGLFSERSGVVNIALDGIMLVGAFVTAAVVVVLDPTGANSKTAILIGLIAGMAAGMVFSLLHAYASIDLNADQTVSGTALNLLAAGITVYLCQIFFNQQRTPAFIRGITRIDVPVLKDIPVLGEMFFKQVHPTFYLTIILVFVTWYVVFKTPFGLRMRSCGEFPQASASMGINVRRMRYFGVLVSGALAGLAGGVMVLTQDVQLTVVTIHGFGFIAIAALIFGKWNPFGILGAGMFFGFSQTLGFYAKDIPFLATLPTEFFSMFPYVLTIIALVIFAGKSVGPKAAGEIYDTGKR